MGCKHLLLFLLVLVAYVCLGGLIFSQLEGEHESHVIKKLHTITENETCLPIKQVLHMLTLEKISAERYAWQKEFNSSSHWQWNYVGSLFFSLVAITTIGYGNQTPQTDGGRVALVLYALIGIPLFVVTMNHVVMESKLVVDKVKSRLPDKVKPWLSFIVALIITLLGILIIILPLALISKHEGWTPLIAVYFLFETLSSIGFGDYVPGGQFLELRWYRMFISVWLFAALVYADVAIVAIQTGVESFLKKLSTKKPVWPIGKGISPKALYGVKEKGPNKNNGSTGSRRLRFK